MHIGMATKAMLFWLAWYSLFAGANAAGWKTDKWDANAVFACSSAVNTFKWGFDGTAGYYSTVCEYEPALGTLAICVDNILRDRGLPLPEYFEKSLATVRTMCSSVDPDLASLSFARYSLILKNASSYVTGDYSGDEILFEPITVTRPMRDGYANAFHFYTGNIDKSNLYGFILNIYVIGFCLVAAAFRLFDLTAINSVLFRMKFINYVRGYLTIPTLNGFHAADYVPCSMLSGLLPSRLEAAVIICFFVFNLFFLSIGYEIDHLNILFGSKSMQITRFVGDRSGCLAIAHVPLIILFSTRNNIVEHLTGFKYTTFISLHKWIGRSMILDVCIHSISYTWYAYLTGSLAMSQREKYWMYGSLATITMIMLLFWSSGFIRRNRYELFLYLHILLAVLFFFATWKHLTSIGWTTWLLVSLTIWILERLIRIGRILHFGVATAAVQVIGDDLLRITISKSSNFIPWSSKPGQYVFLYFMDPRIFWQSHPFTVIDAGDKLVVVARAKKGATRMVLNRAANGCTISNNFTVKMKVCVEGPYGSVSPLRHFDNLLLLCGGSGLPGPLSHALELGESSGPKNGIEVVISVRSCDILEAYRAELTKLQRLHINLQIYITQHVPTAQYGSLSSSSRHQAIFTELKPFATFHVGRPDISNVITNAIGHPGSLAVLTCGPPVFVDKARDITAASILRNPARNIAYFEEYQCW